MSGATAVDVQAGRARCSVVEGAPPGLEIVVGHQGVRVTPLDRSRQTEIFTFMASEVSAEKPKKVLIGAIATEMKHIRKPRGAVLVPAVPAVVHPRPPRYLPPATDLPLFTALPSPH